MQLTTLSEDAIDQTIDLVGYHDFLPYNTAFVGTINISDQAVQFSSRQCKTQLCWMDMNCGTDVVMCDKKIA